MSYISQIAILGFNIVASMATYFVASELFGFDAVISILIAALFFAILLIIQLHLLRTHDQDAQEDKLAIVRHDVVDLIDSIRALEKRVMELGEQGDNSEHKNRELVAEIKVLQTLLSQVASGRVSAGKQSLSEADVSAGNGKSNNNWQDGPSDTLGVIQNALQENRIDLYLQPIVRLPSRRTILYECFSRVRDEQGKVIFPNEYLPIAEHSGLAGTLDNLLLFRCIQVIRRLGVRRPGVRFFCNISSHSLNDPEFFPQFIEYMSDHTDLANRLVFEFVQDDVSQLSETVEPSLMKLGVIGFQFSMDNIKDLDLDLAALSARNFRYLKIDADTLLLENGELADASLPERCRRSNLDIIVSKIEKEEAVLNILDYDLGLGQGYLFGKPRPSRDNADSSAPEVPQSN